MIRRVLGLLFFVLVLGCVGATVIGVAFARQLGDKFTAGATSADSSNAGNIGWARVGDPAPEFVLRAVDGRLVKLSDFRGKLVLVNFWATWCRPCASEMPALQAASERYRDDVVILGVNVEESAEAASSYAKSKGLTFTIVLDTSGATSRTYRVRGIPTTFFVDRDGILREQFTGEMNASVIDRRVSSLR